MRRTIDCLLAHIYYQLSQGELYQLSEVKRWKRAPGLGEASSTKAKTRIRRLDFY